MSKFMLHDPFYCFSNLTCGARVGNGGVVPDSCEMLLDSCGMLLIALLVGTCVSELISLVVFDALFITFVCSFNLFLQFLFRNMISSTVSGSSDALSLFTRSPAAENVVSEGIEVAGTARYCLASLLNLGNFISLSCHHFKGSDKRTGSER